MSCDKNPCLAIRFGSLFMWGRPPLPGDVADKLAQLVCDLKAKNVLAVGTHSATALTALGFGDATRTIYLVCPQGEWGEWYSYEGDEYPDLPNYDLWLDAKIFRTAEIPGKERSFDLVYIDKDYPLATNDIAPERIASIVHRVWSPQTVALGFCEGFYSPTRLRAEFERFGYAFTEISGQITNAETNQIITQSIAYAKRPEDADANPS